MPNERSSARRRLCRCRLSANKDDCPKPNDPGTFVGTLLAEVKKRTWGEFRGRGHGHGRVQVRKGLEKGPQSVTESRFFRGMDGDKAASGTKDVWISDSLTGTPDPHSKSIEDSEPLAGTLREAIVYNGVVSAGANGPVVSGKPTICPPRSTISATRRSPPTTSACAPSTRRVRRHGYAIRSPGSRRLR